MVRFSRRYEYRDPETKQRTVYPTNWSGDLPPPIAQAARQAGALYESEDMADVDLESMTKAELEAEAEARGIDVSQARTKADMIAALQG